MEDVVVKVDRKVVKEVMSVGNSNTNDGTNLIPIFITSLIFPFWK